MSERILFNSSPVILLRFFFHESKNTTFGYKIGK